MNGAESQTKGQSRPVLASNGSVHARYALKALGVPRRDVSQ